MSLPAEGYQLKGISSKSYEHPADRAATAALKAIPHLDTVVRKVIEFGYERALRRGVLGSAVRLGEDLVLQRDALAAFHLGKRRRGSRQQQHRQQAGDHEPHPGFSNPAATPPSNDQNHP